MCMREQWRLQCTSQWGQQMSLNKHVHCVAIAFKMTEWGEQWICIKFFIKLENSFMETIQMVQKAFRDDARNAVQIKLWHKCFKDGQERWKRSTFWKACDKQNTWECWMCKGCNQQRSTTDSARARSWSGDSKNHSSEAVMQDPGTKHVMAKFVLQLLLPEQKEHRATVANDLIQTTTNEPDFLKITTGDESWVYSYVLEMKAQSSQWKVPGSPRPRKAP